MNPDWMGSLVPTLGSLLVVIYCFGCGNVRFRALGNYGQYPVIEVLAKSYLLPIAGSSMELVQSKEVIVNREADT